MKAGEIVNAVTADDNLNQALAKNIISQDEFDKLQKVRAEVMDVVNVDDFPFDAFDRTNAAKKSKITKIKAA